MIGQNTHSRNILSVHGFLSLSVKRPRGKTIEGGLRRLMVTHSTVAKILNSFYCLFQKRIAYIQVNEPSVLMLCIDQEVSAFIKVLGS